jgi:flavin reductase (DIM6/NTAB) family NADH-FMN oxidoreductase RutF
VREVCAFYVDDMKNAEATPESSHLVVEPSILYFGTPVALIGTLNEDGSPNLAPMSSAWALGTSIVLGLGAAGQTIQNLQRLGECTISLPDASLWQAVERLAPLTGRDPVPEYKASRFRFEPDKFRAAGLTPQSSDLVAPPRVRECALQFEATIAALHRLTEGAFCVEARVVRVHATTEIVVEGSNHIDPHAWQPLLYVFRHYFRPGDELGKTFRAEI